MKMWGIYKVAVIVTLFTCISLGICELTADEEVINVAAESDTSSESNSANSGLTLPPNNEDGSVIDLSKVFDRHKEVTK